MLRVMEEQYLVIGYEILDILLVILGLMIGYMNLLVIVVKGIFIGIDIMRMREWL